jgi:hypothetical protein
MSTEFQRDNPGIASLVGGIVNDTEHLVSQQVDLLKQEIRQELGQARRAAVSAALGFSVVAIGAILILIMAAEAIAAYSDIPVWACYGIVGVATAVIGALLLFFAKKEASDVHLLPPRETAGAIKENYQWMTGQRKA